MGICKVNLKLNAEVLKGEMRFKSMTENEMVKFRIAPPLDQYGGMLFFQVLNHYKLTNPDNSEGRKIALADLSVHGTPETGKIDYINQLIEILKDGTSREKSIAKDLKSSRKYYCQGWLGTDTEDGKTIWSNCRLLSMPKIGAIEVQMLMQMQEDQHEPNIADPVNGQAILIKLTGNFKDHNIKYRADRTGKREALDDIIPGWKEQQHQDMWAAIGLNICTREDQKRIVQFSYPELDWDKLHSEFGL